MKNRTIILTLIVFSILVSACKYDFILPEEVPVVVPGADPISFSQKIVPIFTEKCVACHKIGGTAPDLSSANAYNSINTAKYINKTTPASSLIYSEASPATNVHSHKKYSASEAALVLIWITEGAKNN